MSSPHVLVIDHFDSFVHNLVDDFASAGSDVTVLRSDLTLDALGESLARLSPDLVVLSPGPGTPAEAGVMPAFLP